MGDLASWKDWMVHQKRWVTGCIPAGYEMLLRAAEVEGVDYSTFQDEFDLDVGKDLTKELPSNNFDSVAKAIQKKYQFIHFAYKRFIKAEGVDKLHFVETKLAISQVVLVSLSMKPLAGNGWHIMPIVESNENQLTFLYYVDHKMIPKTLVVEKAQFVEIHDNYDGGKDIAWLEKVAKK